MFTRKTLQWSVGHSTSPDTAPQECVPATVPGAVQLDWSRTKRWGPHYYAENFRDYAWMEDVYWIYSAPIPPDMLAPHQRLFFVCKGVDYRFKVRCNGVELHDQEGMFTPFEIDLTGRVKEGDELEVVIFPAPKSCVTPVDRNQANQSCKPAVSYEWDFHPRLIPLGIWDETFLELRPAQYIQSAELRYALNADFTSAELTIEIEVSAAGNRVHWQLFDRNGGTVAAQSAPAAAQVRIASILKNPELWWPNGQGFPALYTSRVELRGADGAVLGRHEARVGFRSVRLVMNPGSWDEPLGSEFPKGPSNPPITMEVNGRPIFCKGSNWVFPDIFPGKVTADDYRALLDLVKGANMNMLRLWGGAAINKESFYKLCDERGIMIWQEFPLACNRYEGTPHYLKVLDQESQSIIKRLRKHTCLVLWCGGNELFNNWSLMTNQDLALRLLNRNCYDLDPERPFLPTSPIMGMGHGHYLFRDPQGREVFQLFARSRCSAYTEFGCPSPASVPTLPDHSRKRALPAAARNVMGQPPRLRRVGRRRGKLADAAPD